MIHAQLSEAVEQSEVTALHAGEIERSGALAELFARIDVGRCLPAYDLSPWEVESLPPAVTRTFELTLDHASDESDAASVLEASPLIESVARHSVRLRSLPRAQAGESEQVRRASRGALETSALGCGYISMVIAGLILLIVIATALAQAG